MKVRPSAWWYALVPIAFVAGIAYGIGNVVDEGRAVADSFSRLGSDGRGTVELDAGDQASVFAIWEDGREVQSTDRPGADVVILGPSGDRVTFDEGSGQQTFGIEDTSGLDLGTFEATESGTHQVQVTFDALPGPDDQYGTPAPAPQAAIGRLDWRALVGSLLRPIALGAAVGIAIWIALLVARGMAKRRARRSPHATLETPTGHGGPFV